jgi:uracil-DNA glycosylase
MSKLSQVLKKARACTLCAHALPLGPRPVLRATSTARVLIVGQAPGTKVHESGVPWNDRSGDRLRDWLDVDREAFYDESRIAIMPMGFCYPGRDAKGGDLPPRKECAPEWHPRIRPLLPNIGFTLLVGTYAQKFYLKDRCKSTLTDTVAAWREYGPDLIPLPHPSWRNTSWIKKNPWFERELLPHLRLRTHSFFK